MTLVLRMVLSAWLVAVALWDRTEQRIPNALVFPALGAVALWRLYQTLHGQSLRQVAGMLIAWGTAWALWRLGMWGAGDAKLLMVLFGLFPNTAFTLLLAGVIVLGEGARILARRGSAPAVARDWRAQRHPDAWMPALAGLLYVWSAL